MIDYIVFGLIGLGLLFATIRLVLGPNAEDRVVALDTFNVITIGVIALLSKIYNNPMYLDVALVYALLAFLETIVFARFVEVRK